MVSQINMVTTAKTVFNSFDNFFNENTIYYSFGIISIYACVFYTYLFFTKKIKSHLSRIKNESDFIDIMFDSILLAMIEQASFMVYFNETLLLLFKNRVIIRTIICILFTFTHVISFNNFKDPVILIIQTITTLVLSIIYTNMLPLYSLLLHVGNNLIGVLIQYLMYKILLKRSLFQGKIYFAPISTENVVSQVKSD